MSLAWQVLVLGLPWLGLLGRLTRTQALGVALATLAASLALVASGGGSLDALSLWLLPFAAMVYLTILLVLPRAERTPSTSRHLLVSLGLDLAIFTVRSPLALALLWGLAAGPLLAELPTPRLRRIFLIYHGLGSAAFAAGALALALSPGLPPSWAWASLVLAIMLRKGVVPVHQWLPEIFEHAPLGAVLAFCSPQIGAYAALRLLSPTAPESLLVGLGAACLVTSVYGSCLALGARSVRGAYAGLFLGQSSLVFAGLQCTSEAGLAGGLALWVAGGLALTGLGLSIWALEARRGPSALDAYSGGFERDPVLATCFLVFGLAAVGFPGTMGFVAEELLLDGTTQLYPHVGFLAAVGSCLNGITVLRLWFCLFCGTRVSPRTLAGRLRARERVALLALVALLLGFGLHPQQFVASRWVAAQQLLEQREASP